MSTDLPNPDSLLGQTIDNKYRIEASIGRGGMGEVYQATQLNLGRRVAIKVIRSGLVADSTARDRFRREARVSARLNHPNVVTVHDFGVSEAVGAYLVTEFLSGCSLSDEIRRLGRIPVASAIRIIGEVCAGVQAAHEKGLVHRDLKPANIFLSNDGGRVLPKVLDFGLALVQQDGTPVESRITATGFFVGTPFYMAPEQFEDRPVDASTDVYALGCVLYEMLTGSPPFVASSPLKLMMLHSGTPPGRPSRIEPSISGRIDEVVLRALAKEKPDRYATAAGFSAALSDAEALGHQDSTIDATLRVSDAGGGVGDDEQRPETRTPNNLVADLTSFVGRTYERATVRALLSENRIVVLKGPGGIGKTRLALSVARSVFGEFPSGVWFVPLDPISEDRLVASALASAMSVREIAGADLGTAVSAGIGHSRVLVVLDNCEHLVAGCAELINVLLAACPHLKILATSRAVLGVAGEAVFDVPPLSLPDPNAETSAARVADYEAVRLFRDRVALVNPAFSLTDSLAASIVRLCTLVEGLPLAIELAASRTKILSVEQIVARLGDRLRLLSTGAAARSRQQSLRASIAWSYDLLDPSERALLCLLSQFVGGCNLETVERVMAASAEPPSLGAQDRSEPDDGGWASIQSADAIDLLSGLVDKSLVHTVDATTEVRYDMLESIRDFATERLSSSGRLEWSRRIHADWAVALAEEAERAFVSPGEADALVRLNREHDNFRAALRWALRGGDPHLGLRLAGALGRYWIVRGYLSEGTAWLNEALDAAPSVDAAARAKAHYWAGNLGTHSGNFQICDEQYSKSLDLYREIGDERGIALATRDIGVTALKQGDYDKAQPLLLSSLAAFERLADDYGLSLTYSALGLMGMDRGDYAQAQEWTTHCLLVARRLGNKRGIAVALYNLGVIASRQDDHETALDYYEQSRDAARDLADKYFMAHLTQALGSSAMGMGNLDEAERLFSEALQIDLEINDRNAVAWALWGFAHVAVTRGRFERGLHLLGALEQLRETISLKFPPVEARIVERIRETACAAVGADVARAVLERGRLAPLDASIALALASDDG